MGLFPHQDLKSRNQEVKMEAAPVTITPSDPLTKYFSYPLCYADLEVFHLRRLLYQEIKYFIELKALIATQPF